MQAPVEIAFRHYHPSDEVRTEIAAQARRLERVSSRITSCRVVVTGPQNRRRNGNVFEIELHVAMPNHKDIVVDHCRDDAPEREHALVAIREAFDAAKRQVEEAEQDLRGAARRHAGANPRQSARLFQGGRQRLH